MRPFPSPYRVTLRLLVATTQRDVRKRSKNTWTCANNTQDHCRFGSMTWENARNSCPRHIGCNSFGVVSAHLRPLPRSFISAPSRCHEPGRDYHLCSTVRNSGQPSDRSGNCSDTRKVRRHHIRSGGGSTPETIGGPFAGCDSSGSWPRNLERIAGTRFVGLFRISNDLSTIAPRILQRGPESPQHFR